MERVWCWEGLGAGGEGDDRGWDGWMASLTRWTLVWVNSESWWWTGRPGVLWFMGSQRIGHDWATELNWTDGWFMLMFDRKEHNSVKQLSFIFKMNLKLLKAKRHWGRTLTSSATGTRFLKFYLKHLALSHSLSSFHYCFICPINLSTEFLLLDQKVGSIFWTSYWHHQLNGH